MKREISKELKSYTSLFPKLDRLYKDYGFTGNFEFTIIVYDIIDLARKQIDYLVYSIEYDYRVLDYI